jgi:hypothetical protein
MRSKRRGTLAIAASAAGALLAATLWLPAALAGDTQVQVFDPEGKFEKFIDNGKADLSAGDEIIEIHTLLDPADGSDAGTIYTEVGVLRVIGGGEDLDVTLACTVVLPEGTIVFYGGVRFSQFFAPGGASLPVTGGTGAYELARGTVGIVGGELDGTQGATLTFDLTST